MARQKARELREQIRQGIDPRVTRKIANSMLLAEQAKSVTFSTVSDTHIKMLSPIWETKTETASRVRATVERILDMAGAEGLRTGDNPARWKGNLDLSLALPSKMFKVQHYAALPVDEMPEFMRELTSRTTAGAMALRFGILTAARSGEIRGAKWEEIVMDAKVSTIPGEQMKNRRTHKVPLCGDQHFSRRSVEIGFRGFVTSTLQITSGSLANTRRLAKDHQHPLAQAHSPGPGPYARFLQGVIAIFMTPSSWFMNNS
jgi:integrase